MKVSVITCCYNSARTIEDTVRSVVEQDYADLEYIVVDGGSTDDTVARVQRHPRIARLVSGRDGGIYHALNKGVALATGEVIAFLHSDDFYPHRGVVSNLMSRMESSVDGVYADLVYVSESDARRVVRHWKAGPYEEGLFLKGWMPPHPTLFLRSETYRRLGGYRTDLGSAADYELMLRFIHLHRIRIAYSPEVAVCMRVGGTSNASLRNRLAAHRHDRRAWAVNGLRPRWYTLLMKPVSKVAQFALFPGRFPAAG